MVTRSGAEREADSVSRLIEHFGAGELGIVAGEVRPRRVTHGGARCNRVIAIACHDAHGFVPGADQRLREVRIGLESLGIDHHHVDDLARDLAAVEELGGVGISGDFGEQRVPGHHMLDIVGRGEHRNEVGIRRVDHGQIALGQANTFQRSGEQIVRDAELDEIDRAALQSGDVFCRLRDDAVIAVRKIADDERGAVDTADGRDGERVHIGHDAAVERARRVLIDRFDIVVDLNDLDLDPIFVRPLLDDALISGPAPGHPADIDRPGDLEAGALLGFCRDRRKPKKEAK